MFCKFKYEQQTSTYIYFNENKKWEWNVSNG